MSDHTKRKGSYGESRLGVASAYVTPPSRRGLLLAAGVLVLAALALVGSDLLLGGGSFVSNGPLSSDHATLEADCAACHDPERSVTAERCSVCHEKYGDELGVYTYDAHYLYRSADFRRLVPSPEEVPCHTCHQEHRGRDTTITQVPDARCVDCHEVGSFGGGHPEFQFATDALADRAGLRFPHIQHVREVMKRQGLTDVEKACLSCHSARPDGTRFEPIDFDRHCDACHLTTAVATARLPIRSDDAPGVETLEMIQSQGDPGTEWSFFINPAELRQVGSRVMKNPLHHQDPWVLHNLRQLRRQLYTDGGLADLLLASPDAPDHELRTLYDEALARLEEYATGLRSRPEPEIQAELAQIDDLLGALRARLRDPYAPLDETRFLLALERPREELTSDETAVLEELVTTLTQPCQQCHLVEKATIARVQKDQQTLRRAEFDHRSHILQARCLDCHYAIPVEELLAGDEKVDAAVDNASLFDLPTIDTCRQCHTSRLASQACVTCHLFHPNKERRSELLLYIDEQEVAP